MKQLVSREPVTCNPKYRDPFKFKPECLITQAYNWAPSFDERSDALIRRVISLELTSSFKAPRIKSEDIAHQVVASEYALLVGFALGSVFKIKETGRFTVPTSIQASSAGAVAADNPYDSFANESSSGRTKSPSSNCMRSINDGASKRINLSLTASGSFS